MNRLLFVVLLALGLGLLALQLRTADSEELDLADLKGSAGEQELAESRESAVADLSLSQSDALLADAQHDSRSPVAEGTSQRPDEASEIYSVLVEVKHSKWASGKPVPGVKVRLGVNVGERGQKRETLLTVDTQVDESGTALVELAVPKLSLGEPGTESTLNPTVWGMVVESGYSQRVKHVKLPVGSTETIKLRLAGTVGGTIRGRVVRIDGAPADHGTVILCTLNAKQRFAKTRARERIGSDGRFTVHFGREGKFALHALVPEVGAGTSPVLQLAFGDPHELELRLKGTGVLAGRVIGEDGKPFPKYRLWVVTAGTDSITGLGINDRIREQWDGGLADQHITTDEVGRFRVAGLQSRDYEIRGFDFVTGSYNKLLTEEPVPTDSLGLQLTVKGQRLVLRVLDVDGEPLDALRLQHTAKEKLQGQHVLYCVPCGSDGKVLGRRGGNAPSRSRLDNGDVVIDVEGGKSYAVGVVSADKRLKEEVFYIPAGQVQLERTLQLGSAASGTSLKVRVLDPEGFPFKSYCQVRVLAPDAERILLETGRNNSRFEFDAELGHGAYRVRVSAEPGRGHHGGRIGGGKFAAQERLVELVPGMENVFDVRLAVSGKLKLAIASDTDVTLPTIDTSEIRRDSDGIFQTRGGDEGERLFKRGVLVRLEDSAGRFVLRPVFDLMESAGGVRSTLGIYTMERSWIPLGGHAKSITPIPTGEYTLILSPPGFREIRRRVLIEADKVTKVDVTLTQQDLAD